MISVYASLKDDDPENWEGDGCQGQQKASNQEPGGTDRCLERVVNLAMSADVTIQNYVTLD